MRSTLRVVLVLVLVLALVSPAFAHVRSVGGGSNWTGSPPLPAAAQGNGLVYSFGAGSNISPSHFGGLNTACESLRSNPSVADMWGPPHPTTCQHGGTP